jgi:hypothetical protein
MTYSLSGTFPSQSSTLSVNVNNIVIYNSPGLSFTGPSSSSGNITGFAFTWAGSGKGVISYGGYYPAASDPLYPANFHDNVNVFVGNQGSSAQVDFSNTPMSSSIFGPVGISSNSTGGNKTPSTAQYYGVGGNTGASTNLGNFSVDGVFGTTQTVGSTSISFSVLVDDVNYYMAESSSISVTIT